MRFAVTLFAGLGLAVSAGHAAEQLFVPPYGDHGCWVQIFDGKNFRPPTARITGPAFVEKFETGPVVEPDLRNVGGQDFFRRIDSLIVGPNARLIAYSGRWFDTMEITFLPNAKVANLDVINFTNRIESVKMQCVP